MKIGMKGNSVLVDGEMNLTIFPRGATALTMTKELIDSGIPVAVENHCFMSARGKTRIGRWFHLCRAMWKFSA